MSDRFDDSRNSLLDRDEIEVDKDKTPSFKEVLEREIDKLEKLGHGDTALGSRAAIFTASKDR